MMRERTNSGINSTGDLGAAQSNASLQALNSEAAVVARFKPPLRETDIPKLLGISSAELMKSFCSLGNSCEFGLVQRKFGAEPVDLMRFSSTFAPNVVTAIAEGLARLGDDLIEAELQPANGAPRREYLVRERPYGLFYHPFVFEGEMEPSELEARERRRLGRLRDKLVDDLKTGERIFVFKQEGVAEGDVFAIASAIRSQGRAWLLWVVKSDDPDRWGMVDVVCDGLFKGYIDRFAPEESAKDASHDVWLTICANAHALESKFERSAATPAEIVEPAASSIEEIPKRIVPWLKGKLTRLLGRPDEVVAVIDRATVDNNGILRASGWAMARLGVKAVEIWVGDKRLGAATLGHSRPDAALAHPGFKPGANCGFSAIMRFPEGAKSTDIRISIQTNGGLVQQLSAEDLPPRIHVDALELTDTGNLSVAGWAVASAGVARLDVFVDGVQVGAYSEWRDSPDVEEWFGAIPGAARARFDVTLLVSPCTPGASRMTTLRAVAHDGATAESFHHVTVAFTAPPLAPQPADREPPLKMHIDAPAHVDGAVPGVVRENLAIHGWAIGKTPIESIVIDLDGTVVGSALIGTIREDVKRAHPTYPSDGRDGFTFMLRCEGLSAGAHAVKVTARTESGDRESTGFSIDIPDRTEQETFQAFRQNLPAAELRFVRSLMATMPRRKKIVVAIDADLERIVNLPTTLRSLERQIWDTFKVVITGDPTLRPVALGHAAQFPSLEEKLLDIYPTQPMADILSIFETDDLVLLLKSGVLISTEN